MSLPVPCLPFSQALKALQHATRSGNTSNLTAKVTLVGVCCCRFLWIFLPPKKLYIQYTYKKGRQIHQILCLNYTSFKVAKNFSYKKNPVGKP